MEETVHHNEEKIPRLKAWGWFVGLALSSLTVTAFLTYGVKFLLKLLTAG